MSALKLYRVTSNGIASQFSSVVIVLALDEVLARNYADRSLAEALGNDVKTTWQVGTTPLYSRDAISRLVNHRA